MPLVISFSSAYSQGKRLGRLDLEFDAGMTIPINSSNSGTLHYSEQETTLLHSDINPGITFRLEGRYNFKKTPINAGIQVNMSRFDSHFWTDDLSIESYPTEKTMGIMQVADYNFRRGKKINPYAGIGIAVIMHNWEFKFKQPNSIGVVAPRAGVRLFDRFNVAADYQINSSIAQYISIYAGYYF